MVFAKCVCIESPKEVGVNIMHYNFKGEFMVFAGVIEFLFFSCGIIGKANLRCSGVIVCTKTLADKLVSLG